MSRQQSPYRDRWQGRNLPRPGKISERNWAMFLEHIDQGVAMGMIADGHHISRPRLSAIFSRIDQVLRQTERSSQANAAA